MKKTKGEKLNLKPNVLERSLRARNKTIESGSGEIGPAEQSDATTKTILSTILFRLLDRVAGLSEAL